MPNIKSAVKRVRVGRERTLRNASLKSELRTAVKKALNAASEGSEDAEKQLRDAVKLIDQAASKKVMHKNTASRKKSKLVKAFNNIEGK